MAENKDKFEPFDFYHTGMGFTWTESSFLWKNNNEELLKLSNYGITEQEVYRYEQLIKQRREEVAERHKIYEHRSNFFKVLAVLFLIFIFFFIVAHFNDLMRGTGVLFDIISYPVYMGLIWVAYKYAYPYLAFIIESTQEKYEDAYKYPNNGHPDGYDPRIEKYFNDLLWKLQETKGSKL